MPSFTPRYNLAKPSVNGLETENVWGFDINLNFDKLDAAIIKPAELAEAIEDQIASLLKPGANISLAYNDAAGTLTITGSIGTEQIDDRVAALLKPGPYIGLTYNDAAGTLTISNLFGTEGIHDVVYDVIKAGNNVALAYDDANNRITIHSLGPGGSTGPQNVFDTIHDVQLAEIPAQLKVVTLSGYNRPGDGGPAMPCRRTQGPVTAHDGWFRTADRFKEDGFEDPDNGGYWEYIGNNQPIWCEWFGGSGDYYAMPSQNVGPPGGNINPTPTDNYLPIMKASKFVMCYTGWRYVPGYDDALPFNEIIGPTVQMGYGAYYCSDTLTFDRSIVLQGMGPGGHHASSPSKIIFPAGKKGIMLNDARTNNVGPPELKRASSTIRDIYCACLGFDEQTTKHGLHMEIGSRLENCAFIGFGGNGITVEADFVVRTNANLFYINHVTVDANAVDGVYCVGGDANAGGGMFINATSNGRWGINDQSFLGNGWLFCHTSGNGDWSTGFGGPYRAPGGGGQRTTFVGCYSESDQAPSQVGSPAQVINGIHAAQVHGDGLFIMDKTISGFGWVYNGPSVELNTVNITQYGAPGSMWRIALTGDEGNYDFGYSSSMKAFRWGWNIFPDANPAFAITTGNYTATHGRSIPVTANQFYCPNGIFMGDGIWGEANSRWLGIIDRFSYQGAGVPGRPYGLGDTLINMNAGVVGNNWGELCVTAGVYVNPANTWAVGQNINSGSFTINSANRRYECINGGSGPTQAGCEPVHTSGTNAPGADGRTYKWLGNNAPVFKKFGTLLDATTMDINEMSTLVTELRDRITALEAANGH